MNTERLSFADHQVERAIFHRRVEDFLDRRIEPVDLVDEQNVAVLQICEQRGEVAGLGNHRPAGGAETDAHLAGENACQRGLAETRWSEEQDMVERFAARLGGVDEDAEVLARRLLPDKFVETFGAQRRVGILGGAFGRRQSGGISGH